MRLGGDDSEALPKYQTNPKGRENLAILMTSPFLTTDVQTENGDLGRGDTADLAVFPKLERRIVDGQQTAR